MVGFCLGFKKPRGARNWKPRFPSIFPTPNMLSDKRRYRLLLVLSVLLLTSYVSHGQELELLMTLKSSIDDPQGFLSNWNNNSSPNFCKWNGISCDDSSSHVVAIKISGKNITGEISPSIFQFGFLQTVDLSLNQLTGQIPDNIFTCSSLKHLNLSNNNLTGQIPGGSVPDLETLDFANNILSGIIPTDIGLFTSLKFLDLGGNGLSGDIPTSFSDISSLEFLTLASNQFLGEIPRELGNMKSLKWIYFGYNNLSGEIPSEIGNLASLNHLDLVFNNLTGQIPSSLGNLLNLQYLFLYQNKLSGSIPRSVFGLEKLVSLDLSDNFLSGDIPEEIIRLWRLEILHLFSNKFSGNIPNALASLPRLQVLQLWSNNFSGPIPENLGRGNNLTILDLSTNSLTGKVPDHLCGSGNLLKLILFSNSLEGEIPKSFSSCKSLERVRLQNNHLSGGFPSGFTELPFVYFLDVSGNYLAGRVGEQTWDMPSLQMLNLAHNRFSGNLPNGFGSEDIGKIDFSENGFSGAIPESYGGLQKLVQLKLNGNKLSGEIPEEFWSCKKLVSLDLSNNLLEGRIPRSLSKTPILGELDLSLNRLSGTIPNDLGRVESLSRVNISHNNLHGKLPSTGAFLAINSSSVEGNKLCGGDESSGLPPCRGLRRSVWWLVCICLFVVLAAVSLLAFGLILKRPSGSVHQKKIETEDGVWEVQYFDTEASRSITVDDILCATHEANVISRGKNGTYFKGRSSMKEMEFFVKELDEVNKLSSPKLGIEAIDRFGRVKHPNIAKIIAICSSEKRLYLVYEHIDGKLLREILRGLSWDRRWKIAIGVARALRFLHSSCSPSFTVGGISPEKIMIDLNDEAKLIVSLPKQIPMNTMCFVSSCYVAPEVIENKETTTKSDVYSFGVILIEMLTGKSPSDGESFGVHGSMVDWARYCYSDCHLDSWIDLVLKKAASNNPNEIVEAMDIALRCTCNDPVARPSIAEVVKTLESLPRTRSCVSKLKFSSSLV